MTALSPPPEAVLATFDLAQLVADHQAEVWRYLRYLGADAEDADDLTQETFLTLRPAKFQQRSRAETASYLRSVARNQLLMFRRLQGREINTVEMEAAESLWAEANQAGGVPAIVEALRDCLQHLEGRARQAIDLFYHDRLGRTEIGQRLNLKPDGVKALLRRTRDVLRSCVERHMNNQTQRS